MGGAFQGRAGRGQGWEGHFRVGQGGAGMGGAFQGRAGMGQGWEGHFRVGQGGDRDGRGISG